LIGIEKHTRAQSYNLFDDNSLQNEYINKKMIENSDKRLDDGIDLTKIYRISNIQDLTIENNKSSLIDDKNENLIKEKEHYLKKSCNAHRSSKNLFKSIKDPYSFSSILNEFIKDYETKFTYESIIPAITKTINLFYEDLKERTKIFDKYNNNIEDSESMFENYNEDSVWNKDLIEDLVRESLCLEKDNELIDRSNIFRKELNSTIKYFKDNKKAINIHGDSIKKVFEMLANIVK